MATHATPIHVLALVGLVSILPACVTDTSADEEEGEEQLGQVDEQLLAGRRYAPREVATLLRGAGFPSYVIPEMVCTAKYESSFYERASNRNSNGSIDRGLFQINSIHLGSRGCPSSGAALYNGAANARCAHAVWRSQGLNAWYGYQAHRSECNAYRIP